VVPSVWPVFRPTPLTGPARIHISGNVLTLLRTALRGTTCNAFGSDLRISSPGGLFTYPDVSVICGQVEIVPDRPDTATNPVVLFEILSDATRGYDRGEKFELYKTIPSLREYVIIEQREVLVEQFRRSEAGLWSEARCTPPRRSPALLVGHSRATSSRGVPRSVRRSCVSRRPA
jgi:Uma2 family endonuclease